MGILPRRLMVPDEDFARAQTLLRDGVAGKQARICERVDCGQVSRRQGHGVSQPAQGFRSGLDAVMLAAAVPAREDSDVLEIGRGAGAASLCLAARVPGCASPASRSTRTRGAGE